MYLVMPGGESSCLVVNLTAKSESGFKPIKTFSSYKNPAYGRHQLSQPMQIVGPIQFWRGCVIYRSAPKSGLGPRENVDSDHTKVGTRSTRKF